MIFCLEMLTMLFALGGFHAYLGCNCKRKVQLACRDAVVGRNCRFLQGPQTDQAEVKRLRDAMAADPPRPITVKLLNYRIDGQPFWNNLHVAPVRSACGQVGDWLTEEQCLPLSCNSLGLIKRKLAVSMLKCAKTRVRLT